MIGLPGYCLACDRQLAPPVAERRYVRERGPLLHVPVILGLLWIAVVLGVPALLVAEVMS